MTWAILFFGAVHHHFKDGKCSECGASQGVFGNHQGLENHAYAFIHSDRDDVFGELLTMKFDVIIGNPPYQLNDGGGIGSSAIPLYHKFIEQAKKTQSPIFNYDYPKPLVYWR